MAKVVIIGAKGTALAIAEQIIDAQNHFGSPIEFLGWAIDDPSLGDSILGYPVLCGTRQAREMFSHTDVKFIFALYKPAQMRARVALLQSLDLPNSKLMTFVHPSVCLVSSATLGYGSVVLSHSTIHSNVVIGNFCIINSNVVIEHDTVLGNYDYLAAAACVGSEVQIGNGVFVGLNATIREQVVIGDYAFVGMSSTVLEPVPGGAMVYGNPARRRSKSPR